MAGTLEVYGYAVGQEEDSPIALSEITLCSEPITLRKVAAFLQHVALLMEKHTDDFGHEHFADYDNGYSDCPALIITKLPDR